MNIRPLKIGDITVKYPIIQGGMGVGVSLSNLASAVTNAGGIGVISTAQIGFKEKDFFNNPIKTNLLSIKKEIKLAKDKCKNGIIGANIMVATKGYADYVKAAVEAGIDIIISGAGLPTMLPKLVENTKVKIAPIVSSLKATKVILKLWDKHNSRTADMVIIEGPKAGGHLGYKKDELNITDNQFDDIVISIISEVKKYSQKYNIDIPVIVAGGIYDGNDIAHFLKLGANGVQMATRFVATEECDASLEFKQAYVNAKKDDITIVDSPVGMPGRAIVNPFIINSKNKTVKIQKCFGCLTPCNPNQTPYCISRALINSVNGDIDNGLIFCGENAYKVNEITTVPSIFNELISTLQKA